MNGQQSRRAFLAACGIAVTAGCTAPASTTRGGAGSATTEPDGSTQTGGGSDGESDTATTSKQIDLPKAAAWPTFGGDAANTGRRGDGPGPSKPAATAWRTDVNGVYTMPGPVYADGTVYVGSGELAYAADARTGEPRWSIDLGALTHYFSPTVTADGVLFAAQSNINGGSPGTLTSFEFDGKKRWQREFPVTSSPTERDGAVFVGASPERSAAIRAFADEDGSELWGHTLDATRVRGAPAVVDDTVYAAASDVGAGTGVVAALNAADGSERWVRNLKTEVQAAVVVHDGTVYAQGHDGRLFAFDGASGATVWTEHLGKKAKTAPAVAGDVLVGMVENQLVGVTLETGDVAWRTDIGYTLINGVSVAGKRAYVGGSRLSAVAVDDGSVIWEKPVPGSGGGFGAPVVIGNTLFVGVCIKEEAHDPYDDYMYAYY